MKAKIFLFILFLSGAFSANSADQSVTTNMPGIRDPEIKAMIDSWPRGLPTNGLFCAVQVDRDGEKRPQPVCFINVINTTTNALRTFLRLPRNVLFNLELLDLKGKPVEKTLADVPYQPWTQKQIKDWYHENNHKLKGGRCFAFWPLGYDVVDEFSIPEIFQLKRAGEYTLHLRMQLVDAQSDTSGQLYFKPTWLPEVVAKVRIRPEDIPQSNTQPSGQTNAAPK